MNKQENKGPSDVLVAIWYNLFWQCQRGGGNLRVLLPPPLFGKKWAICCYRGGNKKGGLACLSLNGEKRLGKEEKYCTYCMYSTCTVVALWLHTVQACPEWMK